MWTVDFPLFPLAIRCQNERAFARSNQYAYFAHFYSFRVSLPTTSRLYRYPYFDIPHARPRVKVFAIAFEEVRCASSRSSKFMAGRREPLVPDRVEGIAELRHMFAMS